MSGHSPSRLACSRGACPAATHASARTTARGILGDRGGRGGARMRPGDPHPQHAGSDSKAKWWVKSQRLTVDSGGDRAVRVDLELGGGPLAPGSLPQTLMPTGPLRAGCHRDPEQAVVDPRAGSRADGPPEPVPVVETKIAAPRSARGHPARSSAGRGPRLRVRAPPATCRGSSAASPRGSPRAGPPPRRARARRC